MFDFAKIWQRVDRIAADTLQVFKVKGSKSRSHGKRPEITRTSVA